MKGTLIVSVVCLAVGVGLIFGFCDGTTGFMYGYPLSGTSLHIDITTKGVPAAVGVGLTAIGIFLLVVAAMIAMVGTFRRGDAPMTRRQEPFAE